MYTKYIKNERKKREKKTILKMWRINMNEREENRFNRHAHTNTWTLYKPIYFLGFYPLNIEKYGNKKKY